MKKFTCFLLFAAIYFLNAAWAEPDFSKVRVVTSFYEPYSFSEDGAAQGIAVNQVRKILAQLHFFPPISVYPWARAYNIGLNTPNTLLFSMARTPEREDMFHWIGPVVGFDVYLYKNAARNDIEVSKLRDLHKYKVGALHKDVKGQYLRKNQVEVTDITSEETGIKLLLSNRLDLMPADVNATQYRLEKMGYGKTRLEPVLHLSDISRPLYVAFNKDTPMDVVEAFRAAYKQAFPKSGQDGAESPAL